MDVRPNHALVPAALVGAAVAAGAAVLAARFGGLPGAASVVLAALAVTRLAGAGPWLCAVPAALGAVDLPRSGPPAPRPGPVRIEAVVVDAVRRDLVAPSCTVRLRQRGAELVCVVGGAIELLPGDRLRGVGRYPAQPTRRRSGRPPLLETSVGAVRIEPGPTSPRRAIASWRFGLEARIVELVPGEAGRLLSHLVLGRGPRLSEDLVAAHRATGLAHLLAVSGAHASMLAWMIGFGFRAIGGRDPWSMRAFRWFCAIFLLVYGAITGWQPPVFRALAAFVLVLATTSIGRRVTVTATLAFPALLTALLEPNDFGSASFCLSYAAVAGLGMSGVLRDRELWCHGAVTALRASAWAALATAPLTLIYFGQIAPWTVLATPVLSPLVALMLGTGVVVAAAGSLVPAVAAILAPVSGAATELYMAAVRGCALLPAAPVFAPARPEPAVLAAVACAAAAWVAFRRTRAAVAAACVAVCVPHFVEPPREPPRLALLAVGHGQAAVLTTDAGAAVVVDCGSLADPVRAARIVEDALGRRRRVDALVLSHDDADHHGGVDELLRRVRVAEVWLPRAFASHALVDSFRRARSEIRWVDDNSTVRIRDGVSVSAPPTASASDNDRGLWVVATLAGARCVLPGDAERDAIDAWLEATADPSAEVLVLPHHGRGAAEPVERLLARVRPRACFVSNRDGEHDTALGRLALRRGIPVLHTGARGTVTLTAPEAGAVIRTERPLPLR